MKRVAALLPQSSGGRAIAAGLVLVSVGLFFAWPPLALIIPGAFLVALGITTPPEPAE